MLLQQDIGGPVWSAKSLLLPSFSKVPSPGSSYLQGHHQVMTTKSQEIVVLPCSNAQLQQPLGSQDGPANESVAVAGDFPAWLGSCRPDSSPQPREVQGSRMGEADGCRSVLNSLVFGPGPHAQEWGSGKDQLLPFTSWDNHVFPCPLWG